MSENDLSIRLRTLDGQWEEVGSDRLRGIMPESFQATANLWGSDTCSFVLRRSSGGIYPDLTAFTPCRVFVGGVKVWSGRVKETPTQDGTDESVSVQGEGTQYHLDDDVYFRKYISTRLSDWQDVRGFATADLNTFRAPPTVETGTGALVLGFGQGTEVISGVTHAGAVLDLGEGNAALTVAMEFANVSFAAGNYSVRCRAADTVADIATGDNIFSGDPATLTSPQVGTIVTPRRYIGILIVRTGASGSVGADSLWKVTRVLVAGDPSYVNGTTLTSQLTADDVVLDAVRSATSLTYISTDLTQVTAGTYPIEDFSPEGAMTPREAITAVNAYENYDVKVDVEDRVCFRPRPTAPLYEIGEWSGADFTDASTNSGDAIINRAIVQGTGPDGNPMTVDRSAADQPGAQLIPLASPALTNPSFAVDTSGWTADTHATISRTTVAGEFDSAPAGLKMTTTGQGTVTGTTTGTFARGVRYTLRLRLRRDVTSINPAIWITLGAYPDRVYLYIGNASATFADVSLTWVPASDQTGVTVILTAISNGPVFFDSFQLYASAPTIVDRRNFRKASILPISAAITQAVGQRFADLYLEDHKTTSFRGGFNATGRGGVRKVLGGGSVHPAWLLRDTGALVRCAHRVDPDTGAWTRSGRMATVTYEHDSQTSTVALDEDREGFEALLARYALIVSQRV